MRVVSCDRRREYQRMSIPSGKRFDPIGYSAIAGQCAREGAGANGHGGEESDDNEPWLRYAPLRVREGAAMRRLIGASAAVVGFSGTPTAEPEQAAAGPEVPERAND